MSAKSTQPVEAEVDPPERIAAPSHRWDAPPGRRAPRQGRRRWRWLIVFLLLLVVLGALAFDRMQSSGKQGAGTAPNPPGAQGPNTTAITYVSSPAHPGSVATIQAIADPGASCTLSATDSRGNAVQTGTAAAKADGRGKVAWAWRLDRQLPLGSYRLLVACQPGTTSTSTLVVS